MVANGSYLLILGGVSNSKENILPTSTYTWNMAMSTRTVEAQYYQISNTNQIIGVLIANYQLMVRAGYLEVSILSYQPVAKASYS